MYLYYPFLLSTVYWALQRYCHSYNNHVHGTTKVTYIATVVVPYVVVPVVANTFFLVNQLSVLECVLAIDSGLIGKAIGLVYLPAIILDMHRFEF